jgi:hypothetical protein
MSTTMPQSVSVKILFIFGKIFMELVIEVGGLPVGRSQEIKVM